MVLCDVPCVYSSLAARIKYCILTFRGVFLSLIERHFPSTKRKRERGPGIKRKRKTLLPPPPPGVPSPLAVPFSAPLLPLLPPLLVLLLFQAPGLVSPLQIAHLAGRCPKHGVTWLSLSSLASNAPTHPPFSLASLLFLLLLLHNWICRFASKRCAMLLVILHFQEAVWLQLSAGLSVLETTGLPCILLFI